MFNPFRWLKEGMPLKGKVIIAVLFLAILVGGGFVAFKFFDFTQNNPKFCVSCHLMQPAYDAWAASEHKGLNCHECHHLTIPEQNKLLVSFVLNRPTTVPDRHGKVIVPWKYCIKCHWERDEKYKTARLINQSRMHAKHVFMEQIECVKCHGYRTHQFTAEERFCIKCHQGKTVHGTGMEQLACLNCHTDRTSDLRPGRKKCLFCHGNETVRKELLADATLDVTHYQPDKNTINKAIKIVVPAKAPMQFDCYQCHKPHKTSRPDWGNCLSCHENIINVGKHNTHVQVMGMKCKQCHIPHIWKVSAEQAKKDCVTCHEYREPKSFIGT
ncbi:MAG: cytochrome c3 family protein [Nitrospirota bacterium]|nr:cytochrome c3 family protein [Nitrospirota bacterium]